MQELIGGRTPRELKKTSDDLRKAAEVLEERSEVSEDVTRTMLEAAAVLERLAEAAQPGVQAATVAQANALAVEASKPGDATVADWRKLEKHVMAGGYLALMNGDAIGAGWAGKGWFLVLDRQAAGVSVTGFRHEFPHGLPNVRTKPVEIRASGSETPRSVQ